MYVQVELFTTDYVITGFINTPGERLSDVLNIKNETGVIVNDAQVTRMLALGKTPPHKFIEARVEKRDLLFACPAAKDITQKSMFRNSFRQIYDIEVLVPGFEIIGQIHLTEKLDLRRVASSTSTVSSTRLRAFRIELNDVVLNMVAAAARPG